MKNEDEKVRISKTSFREWLEKLQQESWQLELLISGFALFAVWEARALVDDYENYRSINRTVGTNTIGVLMGYFSWLLNIGWRIFFFNLLIHVLARGLWIGAIGLRYVSGDIDYSYFNYADIFTNFLKKNVGDFDDYIEKLERFSSVLFAYTFLLFFIFLSLNLFLAEVFVVFFSFEDQASGGLFILLFLFLGLIALIDFVTMGGIKKIKEKHIAKAYFVLYRIFSFLTLSFLYRPLLYNFWDEKYTRRLFLISIPYIFLLAFLPRIGSNAYPFFPSYHDNNIGEKEMFQHYYYDDERTLAHARQKGIFKRKHTIYGVSLPSIELMGNYAWFFLRSYPSDAEWLAKNKQITPYRASGVVINGWTDEVIDSTIADYESTRSSLVSELLSEKSALRKKIRTKEITKIEQGIVKQDGQFNIDATYWKVKQDSINKIWKDKKTDFKVKQLKQLNSSLLDLATITIDEINYNDSCDCKFYIHPNLGEKGLRCYFPMKNLAEGPHILHLKRKSFKANQNNEMVEEFNDYYLPFYKINKDF